ncbi:YobI family P-loop NTPase [Gordonia polyisoprenivorans]|uniref:YobI family P-loop NTPase n=1 Tax=Gordonia polyisoprenivorans TaxID=84595 RepID=UPI00351AD335
MGVTTDVPRLRSLSPTYVPDQHKDYVEILTAELTKSGSDAPRNVALTGHYGSGKSSVLMETWQVPDSRSRPF